jgi:hypothetical protein
VKDKWIPLAEIAKLFGLSEETIRRLVKNTSLPLRRVTPYATPGALESELVAWLKAQPLTGKTARRKRTSSGDR